MKVVHIGNNVTEGHRFNGHDLGKYQRELGVNSEHLVWNKNLDDEHSFEIAHTFPNRKEVHDLDFQLNRFYGSNSLFYPFSYDLMFDMKFLDCDIAHFHLIHNNFFGIEYLPLMSRLKPLVWTLHDPWALTGHCVHPLDCERWIDGCVACPDIGRSFEIGQDVASLNWEYKKILFNAADIDIIVASQWMFDRVLKSPFFKQSQLHLVQFGIDLNQFKPADNTIAKKTLGIPDEHIVIAFRATKWIYKGLDHVKKCLALLHFDKPITLLVFNDKGLVSEFSDRFNIVELGWVDDDDVMINAYNAADIFLMPSVAESFGMMAMEAMACGKPVIVMDDTALSEVVRSAESGGIVVPQGDIDEMCKQLDNLLRNPDLRKSIGVRSRATAEKYYNKDRYVTEIIRVYEKAVGRRSGDNRSEQLVKLQKIVSIERDNSGAGLGKNFNKKMSINIVSDDEFKLINLTRRLKKVALVNTMWIGVLKPIFKSLSRILK